MFFSSIKRQLLLTFYLMREIALLATKKIAKSSIYKGIPTINLLNNWLFIIFYFSYRSNSTAFSVFFIMIDQDK